MVEAVQHNLPGVVEVTPKKFVDGRGYFSEAYNKHAWHALGIDVEFVQDNISLSVEKGVLRGLHFQTPPYAQAKLVRVLAGAVFDVAVDIRTGSPTFGDWVGVELTADKGNQLFIPAGFAHAFLTLTPNAQVFYKVSEYYSPACDRSFRFNDPAIGIQWPDVGVPFSFSEKDRTAPMLNELDTGFVYEATA